MGKLRRHIPARVARPGVPIGDTSRQRRPESVAQGLLPPANLLVSTVIVEPRSEQPGSGRSSCLPCRMQQGHRLRAKEGVWGGEFSGEGGRLILSSGASFSWGGGPRWGDPQQSLTASGSGLDHQEAGRQRWIERHSLRYIISMPPVRLAAKRQFCYMSRRDVGWSLPHLLTLPSRSWFSS